MAIVLNESEVQLTTVGTPVALTEGTPAISASEQDTTFGVITANKANKKPVYIGAAPSAADKKGLPLERGEKLILQTPVRNGISETIDLSAIFLDAETVGDKVTVTYHVRAG